jgi:hypothetical protein
MSFTLVLRSGARLLVALGVLATPALLLSSNTACKCDDCGCQLLSCAATCDGPVVVETCDDACPEGLIAVLDSPIQCVPPCGEVEDAIDWSCDTCPEGLVDLAYTDGTTVDCVSACGQVATTVCGKACPEGTFSDWLCYQACDHPLAVCVATCGGAVRGVTCDACAATGLIDRSACPAVGDAGVDGG